MKTSKGEQSYEIGEESAIVIEATSGDVRVQGWDKSQVAVESEEEPAAVIQGERELTIRSMPNGAGDLTVCVPQGHDLVLRLVSGDAYLNDVVGDIAIQSTSGDIRACSIQGEVRVRTISGDIALHSSQLSGLVLETVSGDGTVETPIAEGGHYDLRSVSGDLQLLIPEDQPCTVYSTSLSGELCCGLPHEAKQRGWDKQEILINGGGPEIHIHTVSGDIGVRAAGHLPEPATEHEAGEPPGSALPKEPGESKRATQPLEGYEAASEAEPFQVKEGTPSTEAEEAQTAARRMEILKAIEEGRMSVSEGLARLRQLE